jgi:hypothetical protein
MLSHLESVKEKRFVEAMRADMALVEAIFFEVSTWTDQCASRSWPERAG